MDVNEVLFYRVNGETIKYFRKYVDEICNRRCNIKVFEQLESIIDLILLDELYPIEWDVYRNSLPLWSNINTNYYVKLKENNK